MIEQKPDQPEPGDFRTLEIGRHYDLPVFSVKKGEGLAYSGWDLQVPFVRGSKDPAERIQQTEGVTHESLLEMQIADLQHKSKLLPSRETSIAITKLQEALMWLRERSRRRQREGTLGTYKEN